MDARERDQIEHGAEADTPSTPAVPTKHLTYQLNVYVTIPLTDDPEHPDFYTLEVATSSDFKRGLERGIFNTLKRCEFDCDCEVMDFTVEED